MTNLTDQLDALTAREARFALCVLARLTDAPTVQYVIREARKHAALYATEDD